MASNIPLGSFLQDGVRTGPLYSGQIPNGTGADSFVPFNPTADLSYSSYSAYGPGILFSTQNTWNITPAPTSDVNVVARTNAPADPSNLTLTGDDVATKFIAQSNVENYTQFDWPRVPTVTISGANDLAGPINVTIFGSDWYGFPVQHTYTVQARGVYPTITGDSLSLPAKAFYSVTRVSLSAALTNGAFISVGAADIFGLPFLVSNPGDITSIGWGNSTDLKSNTFLSSPVTRTSTLAAGTVTVPCNAITANSNIQATRNTPAGGIGSLSVPLANRIANTSFIINSSDNTETSTIDWIVTNPSGQYSASGISAAMVAGVVTIYTSQVESDSNIQLTLHTFGTAHGRWEVSAIVPGVSFTVTSTNNTETSSVSWVIMPKDLLQGTSNAIGSGLNPVAGEVFVSVPNITATSNILLTYATNPGVNGGVLSAPVARIQAGIGFTIVSSNGADTARVKWAITDLLPTLTQGTATLVAGTVTVNTASVAANSVILLSYNTENTPATYVRVSAIVAGTSFTITAQANTDVSTINWSIFPANFFLPNFIVPLGVFVPGDQTFPPTATTGDVRGLYAPSTPSNGVNILRFTAYVQGADQWINQVANNQFLDGLTNQQVGPAIAPLTPQDLYGYPQFYTGNPS